MILQRRKTGRSGEGKVSVGLAEPSCKQRMDDMLQSARENAEPQESEHGVR